MLLVLFFLMLCLCKLHLALCQNVDVLVCTGTNNVTCSCDKNEVPLQQEDPLYLANIEKILTAQVLVIRNCKILYFDQYLSQIAASVTMLVFDSISQLQLNSISGNIDSLSFTNIDSLLSLGREIFKKCSSLDDLIIKNVTIKDFEPDTFFEIMIQHAQFENVLFKNISKDSLGKPNISSLSIDWKKQNDFQVEECNFYDVYKLSMHHFINKNICSYLIITREKSNEVMSCASNSRSINFIITILVAITVSGLCLEVK